MKECTSADPVNITIKAIGGKWKAVIMWHLSSGTKRFSELHKLATGVTQKMLTQQLREMERDGLIERKVYPIVPPKVEYSISKYGQTLQPVLKAMAEWGERHEKNLRDNTL
ncbi:MAG: helix-turn-helix domain-containing protein [Candidatus Dojkabacteria bacterium]